MRTALFLFVALLGVGTVWAAPTTLKCTTSEGLLAADLIVDIDNKSFIWGQSRYRILFINERYISAYLEPGESVGGETWVLNRLTGEYLRASVSIAWTTPEAVTKEPGKLTAGTYNGRCARPLL